MSSESAIRRLNTITSSIQAQPCSQFSHVNEAPPDEIFKTGIMYRADKDSRKVDLGVGAYRTNEGKPYVLSSVRKAEELIHNNTSLNKEYLPIDGDATFNKLARELLFGKESPAIKENRIFTCQGISGTGSLRVGAEIVASMFPKGTNVLISKPTWGNHMSIFSHARSGVPTKFYRYWDAKGRKLDLSGLLEDLKNAPDRSVVLLHACAHNPTGVDPTKDQWNQIAQLMKQKNHMPFFDIAYQGFATGDLDEDSWAIRHFIEQGFEMIVTQSFAKNFGLYNERVGALHLVCASDKIAAAVLSQVKILIRANYSNPPAHGARVAAAILGNPALLAEWKQELKVMSGRIIEMRKALVDELKRLGTPGDWSHITSQIGMFSFTGLAPKQVECLVQKHHIYLISNGRISMAGLNTGNVKYVAAAIHDAVTTIKA